MGDAPGVLVESLAAEHQGQLQPEQLVEGQPAAGRLDLAHGARGRWIPAKAAVRSRRPSRSADVVVHGVGERPGPVEGLADQPADAGRGQRGLLGQRVDRVDPPGRRPVVPDRPLTRPLTRPLVGAAR